MSWNLEVLGQERRHVADVCATVRLAPLLLPLCKHGEQPRARLSSAKPSDARWPPKPRSLSEQSVVGMYGGGDGGCSPEPQALHVEKQTSAPRRRASWRRSCDPRRCLVGHCVRQRTSAEGLGGQRTAGLSRLAGGKAGHHARARLVAQTQASKGTAKTQGANHAQRGVFLVIRQCSRP